MKNPLKDETQELIDSYANKAEERTRIKEEQLKNATRAKEKREKEAKLHQSNNSKAASANTS